MSSRSAFRSARSIPGAHAGRPARRGAAPGRSRVLALGLSLGLVLGGAVAPVRAVAEPDAKVGFEAEAGPGLAGEPILLAQDGGTTPRELEPRYPAPEPGRPGPYNEQEREVWNGDYVFGITRSLVRSTVVPAAKAPLFLFTVPLDIAFLPFALIGGFFG